MNDNYRSLAIRFIVFIGLILSIFAYLFFRYETKGGNAELYFLPLVNADATVVISGGKVLMIDTGAPEDLDVVMSTLDGLNIQEINTLLLTHPDKDHIGNATDILEKYSVGQVIMPDVKKGSEIEKQLLDKLSEQSVTVHTLNFNQKRFDIGDCQMQLIPGAKESYSQINDYSIVGILTCGKVRVFFGGDIEKDRIKELLKQRLPVCEIVKVPHHGRDEKNSKELLSNLNPKLCIITSEYAQSNVQQAIDELGSTAAYTADGAISIYIEHNEWSRKEAA